MQNLLGKLIEKIHYLKPREIEGILALILENPGISNNKLVQTTGLPKETLREFKAAAAFLLKTPEDDSIYISDEYLSKLKEEGLRTFDWRLLTLVDKTASDKLKEIRGKHKLVPNRELDQFFATEESSIAKALLLDKKGLLNKTKVALLGDDDLVSIALSLTSKEDLKISVFDADTALLSTIEAISKDLGKENIQTVEYDARNALNSIYKGQFDVVVTDPPYTPSGVALFLSRAIELLQIGGDKGNKYICLYFGTSSKTPEKTVKIQEIINQLGLVITDRIENFAQYDGAESIGSNSSVYVLKTTPFSKPLNNVSDFSHLYTHQQAKEDRFPYVDHVVAKLYSVPTAVVNSKSALLKALGEFCNLHKLKVVDEKLTKFKNGGMTITYILSNSNLVIHTWPELNAIHIDLITCAPIYNKERLGENLSKLLATKKVEVRAIE
jgi:predicted methyltransferase/S-adenosylmethionine/arginine decarboxylase-like enzyme